MSDERRNDLTAGPAYLSIGSNIGEREIAVLRVPRILRKKAIGRNTRISSLYETDPVGAGVGGRFINAVVEFEPLLCPVDLLKRLQTIEKQMGRRGAHDEPRELDIDILTLGSKIIDTDTLIVPHPRLNERAFVLVPLREIAPDFRCPVTGRGIAELLAMIPEGQRVERISRRKNVFA